ncbi:hypothetical protein [Fusobacterium animalis]|jgi:hypothetical protein|uniref:hypothetical protein n=1 Tax=Fusobacterium animalis TaxID=76859 RepID=UPI003254557F
MLDKVIINLFGIDLYFMDLLTIAVILLFASLVLVKLDKNSEDKEVKKNLAEQYNYKILTKDTMEVRYDKEVKGIENDRIIFRKK